jgi:hypothetical protein
MPSLGDFPQMECAALMRREARRPGVTPVAEAFDKTTRGAGS